MNFDSAKIDEAVLAVLFLTASEHHGVTRVWKTIDWDTMSRLHECGFISPPENANKSVYFTPEGLARARVAAERLFSPGTK